MLATELLREQKRRVNRWRATAISLLLILSLVLLGLFGVVTGRFSNYIVLEKPAPTVAAAMVVKVKDNG